MKTHENFNLIAADSAKNLRQIFLVRLADYEKCRDGLSSDQQQHLAGVGFKPEIGARVILPEALLALVIIANDDSAADTPPSPPIWWLGDASQFLPPDTDWRVSLWGNSSGASDGVPDGVSAEIADDLLWALCWAVIALTNSRRAK